MAIDPGPIQSAFVVWDSTRIAHAAIEPNQTFSQWIRHFRDLEGCKAVYIEMVACYGMPVGREVFDTCVWIGRFTQMACDLSMPAVAVLRAEVKLHHCKNLRAKDANVSQALRDKYGGKGTKAKPGVTYPLKSHLWQAFAIATMVTEQNREMTE